MKIKGELEIDETRGIVYFHDKKGITKMRLQGLPKPIKIDSVTGNMLDIRIQRPVAVNWTGQFGEWF